MPAIRIAPTIASRATALNFEQGDCIGLQIMREDQCYMEHVALTYNGNYFVGSELRWYGNSDEASTLMAYYPYQAQGFPKEFSVALDQRTPVAAFDLLGAVRSDVKPTDKAVDMRFYHLFSRLQLLVQNETAHTIQTITVGNTIPTAVIDWTNLSVTPKADTAPAILTATPDGVGYTVILIPQTAVLEVVVTTSAGTTLRREVEATLLGGKSYTLALTLQEDRLAISLAGEITDWEDGGELGQEEPQPENPNDNQIPDDPTEPEEPAADETLLWGDTTYPTRTIGDRIWMAENARYLPSEELIGSGVWYPENNATVATELGYLYNYDVIVTLVCPEGWRVPTKADLETLIGVDCGTDFFVPAGMCNARDGEIAKYSTNKNYLISSTIDGDNNCYVLEFTQGEAVTTKSILQSNGYSLRLVRDK